VRLSLRLCVLGFCYVTSSMEEISVQCANYTTVLDSRDPQTIDADVNLRTRLELFDFRFNMLDVVIHFG